MGVAPSGKEASGFAGLSRMEVTCLPEAWTALKAAAS
jgi:hypothetical protein